MKYIEYNDINNRKIKSKNYTQSVRGNIPNKNTLVHIYNFLCLKNLACIVIFVSILAGCNIAMERQIPIVQNTKQRVPARNLSLSFKNAKIFNINKAPLKTRLNKDKFEKGISTIRAITKSQIEWQLSKEFQGGEYYLALPVICRNFLEVSEIKQWSVKLFKNDKYIPWTSHSIPVRNWKSNKKRTSYNSYLRTDKPIQLKKGDILRITPYRHTTIGPLQLSTVPWKKGVDLNPSESLVEYLKHTQPAPITLTLSDPIRSKKEIKQAFEIINTASLPKTMTVSWKATDYLQKQLLGKTEKIILNPGEKIKRNAVFSNGDSGRISFIVKVTIPNYNPIAQVKFYVSDIKESKRTRSTLSGEWQYCFIKGSELGKTPPGNAKWETIAIPSYLPKDKGHCAWFKKVFTPPHYINGKRVVLKFQSMVYESWIYVNGQKVHYQKNGTEPFEADITKAFLPGKKNEILIALRDWLAYSPKNRERLAKKQDIMHRKDLLFPVGHLMKWKGFGITEAVYIEGRPAIFVEDVFITTSVREKKIKLKYKIKNQSSTKTTLTLAPEILDKSLPYIALPEKKITIKAGETVEFILEQDWKNPILWEPGKPYLYVLATSLKTGRNLIDKHYQRFGFREMWIEGVNFIVNGKKMKIRSKWNRGFYTGKKTNHEKHLAAMWSRMNDNMTNRDVQLSRTHNSVGIENICDIADELGIMIKAENGNVCQIQFTYNQEYWDNVLKSELSMIDAYKNHPSVFMWSAGNENVWCFGHGGEKIRNFAFKEMAKIAQAMEDFDQMKRPVEWEADGDLNGKWKFYALHYCKELVREASALPNGAWWNNMDGKTPYPYYVGSLVPGSKPMSTGEAFWPASLYHPYALSILMGDANYQSGFFWRKGWLESSMFILNGFRDAEFALVDVYTPLKMIKEKTIVFKEEVKEYYAGRTIVRHFNIHNDSRENSEFDFKWTLARADNGKICDKGNKSLNMGPADIKRIKININLPRVDGKIDFIFKTELLEGEKLVHTGERQWTLYPQLKVSIPKNSGILLFDPHGETKKAMDKLGIPFTAVKNFSDLEGKSLIIGNNAFKKGISDEAIKNIQEFAGNGHKVLILEQDKMPELLLPIEAAQIADKKNTMTFARAPKHPALNNLPENGLKWWGEDHYVSKNNLKKIFSGNWLPIVDSGTADGCLATPLFEEYYGDGTFIVSQLLLTEKIFQSPEAGLIFKNLLTYLIQPEIFRSLGKLALITGSPSSLKKLLDINKIDYVNIGTDFNKIKYPTFTVAGIDLASTNPEQAIKPLRNFTKKGGKVLLYNGTPASSEFLDKLLGIKLEFHDIKKEGDDVKNHIIRIGNEGIMAGISNHELFWPGNEYLKHIRREGGWYSMMRDIPKEEFIVDYYCTPLEMKNIVVKSLTMPSALLEIPSGKGCFIVSQINLHKPIGNAKVTARRLASLLFTNLGARIKNSGQLEKKRKIRLASYKFSTVDLTPFANRGLKDDQAKKIVGWSNQGENDMRNLPIGKQAFANVPFFIGSPKSAIVLYSKSSKNMSLPKQVNILLGKKADALFFLQGMAWGGFPQPFKYRVNYADGTSCEIPIRKGEHIADWWADPQRYKESMAMNNTVLAWKGPNPTNKGMRKDGVSIYCYEWKNPEPAKNIKSIDFMTVPASGFSPVPALAGLTVAETVKRKALPASATVVDVIGTAGLKIEKGNRTFDIYYIGVKGLTPKHPYYKKAVEKHRKMCLGKKIDLHASAVKTDPEGNLLSYVYFSGEKKKSSNSINAKILGQGLGEKGNFHGNNESQMDFGNLEFISKSNKTGLWRFEKK